MHHTGKKLKEMGTTKQTLRQASGKKVGCDPFTYKNEKGPTPGVVFC